MGSNRAGIQITPGFSSGWGILTSKINGTSNSLETKYNIITTDGSITSSKGTIKASDGNVWGNNFGFNDSKSWTAHGNTYNSQSLQQHLAWLYSLVNSAYNRADSAYTRAGNAQTAANNAQSRADSAYSLANTKVSTSTFNSHHHTVYYDMQTALYEIDPNQSRFYLTSVGSSGSYSGNTSGPR